MRTLLFLLLLLAALPCRSQTDGVFHRLLFKFTPTSLFNPNTACVMPGFELKVHPHFSIQGEYGFQYKRLALLNWNHQKHDWHYKTMRGEGRCYWFSRDGLRLFTGAGVFAVFQEYTKHNGFVTLVDGRMFSYEWSNIERDTWGVFLSPGAQFYFLRHFFLEAFAGFGWKWLRIDHLLLYEAVEESQAPFQEWVAPPKDESEGYWSLPHLHFGIRAGCSFWKGAAKKLPPHGFGVKF